MTAKRAETIRIDDGAIEKALAAGARPDAARVRDILAAAAGRKGLPPEDLAALMGVSDPELTGEIMRTAREIKEGIYGRRLVLFAPLYISNLCDNECLYCAFRARNRAVGRRALTQEEIAREAKTLVEQGHKRVLLVAGESYPRDGFDYVLQSIATVYGVRSGPGEIRRVNVNVAPLTVDEFKRLKAAGIGTYQIFQETYHRETYRAVHVGGRKRDYDWRITAPDRAMEAGIDDVGIGILFGLADWRYEVLALLQHVRRLEERFGVGPHTISVPRLEPAAGSSLAASPPKPVSDAAFRMIVALLRIAVPYTGIIMSTRETPNIRRETFAVGVSQISAGSRTNPGGYAAGREAEAEAQFALGDHRPLDEVIRDIAGLGYIPSFCTTCYRVGRTGRHFMELARPGDIKRMCDPNALATFQEYLQGYASAATCAVGEKLIAEVLASLPAKERRVSESLLGRVRAGEPGAV